MQVASLCEYPELLENELVKQIYPSDAIARAQKLLGAIGSVGAYSHSKGVPAIRKNVAKFIEERDGFPAEPEAIYLTSGASGGVSNLLQVLIAHDKCGVLIPIPQYPLYTAELALNKAQAVPYYLIEEDGWSVDVASMREAVHKARADGVEPRALVVINPGNPTGQCLSLENMQEIAKLAYDEKLVLMADEVYQTNVFDKSYRPFYSFKKVIKELGDPYANNLELVSLHSLSKGQIGECGRRGGFFEIVNFSPDAIDQVYKLASIQLCSGLQGQIGVDLMCQPPQEGDESYPQYAEEIATIHKTLRERSTEIHKAFEKMEGVSCNPAEVGYGGTPASARSKLTGHSGIYRVQCTFSPKSRSPRKPSTLQRRPRKVQTPSTACNCWRRLASASCLDLGSARRKGRCISERHSWRHRLTSSSAGSRASTRTVSGI